MSDGLVSLIKSHERHGLDRVSCGCGWWAEKITSAEQMDEYAEHLADAIERHGADVEARQAEIRELSRQRRELRRATWYGGLA